jgi:hypothetical protein
LKSDANDCCDVEESNYSFCKHKYLDIKFAIDSADSKMHQQTTHVIQNLVKIKQQQVRLRKKIKTNQHCLSIFNGSLNISPIKQKVWSLHKSRLSQR